MHLPLVLTSRILPFLYIMAGLFSRLVLSLLRPLNTTLFAYKSQLASQPYFLQRIVRDVNRPVAD
jgi:hypothetical protein